MTSQLATQSRTLLFGWWLALISFVLGISLPVMSIRQFYLFEDQFSIMTAIGLLFSDGQGWLAVLIALFSLGLPVFKLWMLLTGIRQLKRDGRVTSRCLQWIHRYGRWSMLDVFIVAVLVVGIKLSAMVSISLHPGLMAFALSLLLMMLLTSLLQRSAERF